MSFSRVGTYFLDYSKRFNQGPIKNRAGKKLVLIDRHIHAHFLFKEYKNANFYKSEKKSIFDHQNKVMEGHGSCIKVRSRSTLAVIKDPVSKGLTYKKL